MAGMQAHLPNAASAEEQKEPEKLQNNSNRNTRNDLKALDLHNQYGDHCLHGAIRTWDVAGPNQDVP